jgi:hypothetical protein
MYRVSMAAVAAIVTVGFFNGCTMPTRLVKR